jgi:methylenetetrahydrofolate reductase (NADPH)
LINLHYLGIDNVLVLRGDAAKNESTFEPEPGGHRFASDLLKQVMKTKFCIGVAGYPEKHFEAPNMETDLKYLKSKIDCGADYIITQMFFDNAKFYAFVKACREAGINVPIIPGLKPIYSKKQLTVLPKTFHIDLPAQLSNEILKCKTDLDVEQVGTEWLLAQSQDLKKNGVPVLHYYTLGKPHVVANVVREL